MTKFAQPLGIALAVGAHPDDLYDAYSRAKDRQDAAMVATVAAGIVSGYLWYRYIDRRHECRRPASDDSEVKLQLGVQGV